MIELNLIPDIKLQFVRAQRVRRQVISVVFLGGIIVVGLVVLFAMYVYAWEPLRGVIIDSSINNNAIKLSNDKDLNNYLSIQNQLNALPDLHNQKQVYSRIISYLPILNPSAPNNIHITRFSIDSTTNTLTIEAYAATYQAASVFEATLKSATFTYTNSDGSKTDPVPLFQSESLASTALGQDASGNKVATFKINLTVSDPVFAFSSDATGIQVPNKNATDSAQHVPSEIFSTSTGAQ